MWRWGRCQGPHLGRKVSFSLKVKVKEDGSWQGRRLRDTRIKPEIAQAVISFTPPSKGPMSLAPGPLLGCGRYMGIPPAPPAFRPEPPASPSQTPRHLHTVPQHLPGTRDPRWAFPGNRASPSLDGLSNSSERAFSSSC